MWKLVARAIAVAVFAAVPATGAPATTQNPTTAEIAAQVRAAVRQSGARLVRLQIVSPNRAFRLVVKPAHPAPYLKHRANTAVRAMNRITNVQVRFTERYFAVLGPSQTRVFWVQQVRVPGGQTTRWNVREYLADCVRALDLEIEVDPEHAAPPCPAP